MQIQPKLRPKSWDTVCGRVWMGSCFLLPRGWRVECCSPFAQQSVDGWGTLGPGRHVSGGRGLGVNETNASPKASPEKHGQQVLLASIMGKDDCRTGSHTGMDLNLRYLTSQFEGLGVFICKISRSMHLKLLPIKNPADDWHAAGGHLILGPFVSFCASSVLRTQRQESATALSGEPAGGAAYYGSLGQRRLDWKLRSESHMYHS